jgi:hypothetical protein
VEELTEERYVLAPSLLSLSLSTLLSSPAHFFLSRAGTKKNSLIYQYGCILACVRNQSIEAMIKQRIIDENW